MQRATISFPVMLAACGAQQNFILVMTTLDGNGVATTQTVIQGFRSKEQCKFAGDQWHNSMPWNVKMGGNFTKDPFVYICLEPKL